MKKRKTVTISTNLFELKIHWNGVVISTQIGLLIGLFLVRIFTRSVGVQKMCFIFFLIDIFVILFMLFSGASISIEDAGDSKEDKVEKSSLDVSVDHTHKEDLTTPGKSKAKSKGEIHNKVPIPNPQPVKPESTSTAQPVKTESTPNMSIKSFAEMTEEDWDRAFNMEDD